MKIARLGWPRILVKVSDKLRILGFTNVIVWICKCMILRAIRVKYGFGAWHSSYPFESRSYKKIVVDIADDLRCNVAVEVGCGLGEIISRVKAEQKYGFDVCGRVIKAAMLLHGRKIRFERGDLQAVADLTEDQIDVLIAVGWLHEVPGSDVADDFAKLLSRKKIGYLIADEMLDVVPGCRYHHDLAACCARFARKISEVLDLEKSRRIVLLKVCGPKGQDI